MPVPIPVTVITGALGAGKTTLVNRILSGDHGLRIAVVVNEFGELGIDGELIAHSTEDMVEMNNGCVCCQLRSDLVATLDQLVARPAPLDTVLVETSGVADPAPLRRTFMINPTLRGRFRLDGVVTLVDAVHLEQNLVDQPPTAAQIAQADVVLLNKRDLVSEAALAEAAGRIRGLNPVAPIRPSVRSDAPLATLFGLETFADDQGIPTDHSHDHPDVETVSVCFEGALDQRLASIWLGTVLATQGGNLYRCKGVLHLDGRDDRVIFQGVYRHLDTYPGRPWGHEPPANRCVFIGRDLDRELLERGLLRCIGDTEP